MIHLYTAATPNGRKISIMLEETGVPYKVHTVKLDEMEQKKPEFLAMNPNGRIPVIVDEDMGGFAVFESGAILVYLAEKTGKFLPGDLEGRSVVMQWLMFQMSGVGPMHGQAHVFRHYVTEEETYYARDRYTRETNRLYEVLEKRLSLVPFVAGQDYTIADMALWPWADSCDRAGVDISRLPNLKKWFECVAARPAVHKGSRIPPSQERTEGEKNVMVSKILA